MANLGGDFWFGSPDDRQATVFLHHVAGFEVPDVTGNTKLVTPADLERDAGGNSRELRRVLDSDYNEVARLSSEYLLRSLVVPNLPFGFRGDEQEDPVILGADIQVNPPGSEPYDLREYAKAGRNSISVEIAPTLGRLLAVSYRRGPELGGYGVDVLSARRGGLFVSLFGADIQVNIRYDQRGA